MKVYTKFLAVAIMAVTVLSCQPKETKVETTVTTPKVEEVEVIEQVWLVDEYHINEIPVTTHPSAKPRVKRDEAKVISKVEAIPAEEVDYSTKLASDLHLAVQESEALVPVQIESVTELAIPLDENQTVTAYNNKGKLEGAALVVSNKQTGEIDHIIFENKHHHKDYYNVQAGMSAREVKKLRKEMKHMTEKGQVFYYSDESNIMYLLDIKLSDGEEFTDEMVDQSFVSAIVWKDKNHKDHPRHKHGKA
jgi:hypothetical protein